MLLIVFRKPSDCEFLYKNGFIKMGIAKIANFALFDLFCTVLHTLTFRLFSFRLSFFMTNGTNDFPK